MCLGDSIVESSDFKTENFRKRGRKRKARNGGTEFGDFLETLRTEQGWTLHRAAEESKVSHRVIAKLENGKLDTSLANLENYLNLYGFTVAAKRLEQSPADIQAPGMALDDRGLPKW